MGPSTLPKKLTTTKYNYIMKTNDFMQDIGQRLGYDYVMSYRAGGAMLYANPNHDITNEIIELLNQEYKSLK